MSAKKTTKTAAQTKTKAPAKRAAPKAVKTPAPAAEPSDIAPAPTHSWEDLVAAHGRPTAEDRELFGVTLPAAALVEVGAKIGSSRVLTDLLRFCGQIHDDQERTGGARAVLGFSEEYYRVIIDDGAKLAQMFERRRRGARETGTAARAEEATLQRRTISLRQTYDQLHAALDHATRGEPALSTRVAACFTRAESPELLVPAAESLAKLANEVIGDGTSVLARRLAKGGITADKVEAFAAEAKGLTVLVNRGAGPRVGPAVTQRDLDLQDGICVAHMQALVDLFGAAREADPSVPNLVPIAARSLFGRRTPGSAAPTPAAPAKAPEPDPQPST